MFGQVAKSDERMGKLHQFVVSKLIENDIGQGVCRSYYVLHTRTEDPVSVMLEAFNKLIDEKKLEPERIYQLIYVIGQRTSFTDQKAFDSISATLVRRWGSDNETSVLDASNSAKGSCILGYSDRDANE